jgi:hypothetical protein
MLRHCQCRLNHPLLAALVCLHLLQVADAAAAAAAGDGLRPNCTTSCSGVSVHPFGIEPGCYLQGFNLNYNASYTTPRLFL